MYIKKKIADMADHFGRLELFENCAPIFELVRAIGEIYIMVYSLERYIEYSVKCSDITRWKQGDITPPPLYFILWNAVTSLGDNKII